MGFLDRSLIYAVNALFFLSLGACVPTDEPTETSSSGGSLGGGSAGGGSETLQPSTPMSVHFVSISPTAPSSSINPIIKGVAGADVSTVALYSDSSCVSLLGSSSKTIFQQSGIALGGLAVNSQNYIFAKGISASGAQSDCYYLTAYVHDNAAPANATLGSSLPVSPSTVSNPLIRGTVALEVEWVLLYSDMSCSTLIGASSGLSFSLIGATISATSNATTTIYSKTQDLAGNQSACSSAPLLSYTHTESPWISFSSISPLSPSTDTTPTVIGTAAGSVANVTLYSNSGCSSSIGAGTRSDFAGAGITLTVGSNSQTYIYGKGSTGSLETPCTPLTSYVHDAQGPNAVVSVGHDGFFPSLTQSPVFSWAPSSDTGSGLLRYEYSIGSSVGATDIKTWTDVGLTLSSQASGLSLSNGLPYYVNLRVIDQLSNVSAVTSSAGWTTDTTYDTLSFISPSASASMTTRFVSVSGICDGTNNVAFSYGANTSGPTSVACVNGIFTGIIDLDGPSGARSLTASQISSSGNSRSVLLSLSYDVKFMLELGFNGHVDEIVFANDSSGDVYVGGNFTTYKGLAQSYLVRLNADGSVDQNFNVSSSLNGRVYAIALAPDASGDVYVGGDFTLFNGGSQKYLVRLNSNGTVDSSWSPPGTGLNSSVDTIIALPGSSDTILVGGDFTSYNGTGANYIIALRGTGAIETAFAYGTGFNGVVRRLQPVGGASTDIYIGGSFTTYKGVGANYIARISSTGAVVGSFTPAPSAAVYAIASDPASGDVWIGGAFLNVSGNTAYRYLARLNANGSLDTSFAPAANVDSWVYALHLNTAQGYITVGGAFTGLNGSNQYYLARLTLAGAIVAGFDTQSTATVFGTNNSVYCIKGVPSSDEVVVGGAFTAYRSQMHNYLVRVEADGDPNIGTVTRRGPDNSVYSVAQANDGTGKYYMGGAFTNWDFYPSSYIARLKPDGNYDNTFVVGTGFNNVVDVIVPDVDASGDIYVGGVFTNFNSSGKQYLVKLNSDGSVDTGFNPTLDGRVRTILQDPDTGKLYIGGDFTTVGGITTNRIVRLNTNGSRDPVFNVGTGASASVHSIIYNADRSRLYVGGAFGTFNTIARNYITRLYTNGALDDGFNIGTGFNSSVYAMGLNTDASGDILVGGAFTTYDAEAAAYIAKLTDSGSKAPGFSSVLNNLVFGLQVANDQRVYLAGYFTTINAGPASYAGRIFPNGSRDSSFSGGTAAKLSSYGYTVYLENDGRVWFGSYGGYCNGVLRYHACRFHSDGSLD